eukprot:m.1585001 g.1585001  ORF g.1585001 m.1585001 type:complete len:932 (+) comp25322_c0_seq11:74-2869(+)
MARAECMCLSRLSMNVCESLHMQYSSVQLRRVCMHVVVRCNTRRVSDTVVATCSLQQRAESLLRIVHPPGDNYGSNPREVALLQDKHNTTHKAVETLAQAVHSHAQRLQHTPGAAPTDLALEAPAEVMAEVMEALDTVHACLKHLQKETAVVGARLHRSTRVQQFLAQGAQVVKGVAALGARIDAHDTERPRVTDVAGARDLVVRHDALLEMLRVRAHETQALLAVGTELQTAFPADATTIGDVITAIQKALAGATDRGTVVRRQCSEWCQHLNFKADVGVVEKWIDTQMQVLAKTPCGDSIAETTRLQTAHESFEKGVEARQTMLRQLESTLVGFISDGHDHVGHLESAVTATQRSMHQLAAATSAHTDALSARLRSLDFAQRLSELRTWIRDKTTVALADRDDGTAGGTSGHAPNGSGDDGRRESLVAMAATTTTDAVLAAHDAFLNEIEGQKSAVPDLLVVFEALSGDEAFRSTVLAPDVDRVQTEWVRLQEEAVAKGIHLRQRRQTEELTLEGAQVCAVVADILRAAKEPDVGGTLAQWSAHKESFTALQDRVDAVRRTRVEPLQAKTADIVDHSDPPHPNAVGIRALCTEVVEAFRTLEEEMSHREEMLTNSGVVLHLDADMTALSKKLLDKVRVLESADIGSSLSEVELQQRLHEGNERDGKLLASQVTSLTARFETLPRAPDVVVAIADAAHRQLLVNNDTLATALSDRAARLQFQFDEFSFIVRVTQTQSWIQSMHTAFASDPDVSKGTNSDVGDTDSASRLLQRHRERGDEIDVWSGKIKDLLAIGRTLCDDKKHTELVSVVDSLAQAETDLRRTWSEYDSTYQAHLDFVNMSRTADDLEGFMTRHENALESTLNTFTYDMGKHLTLPLVHVGRSANATIHAQLGRHMHNWHRCRLVAFQLLYLYMNGKLVGKVSFSSRRRI